MLWKDTLDAEVRALWDAEQAAAMALAQAQAASAQAQQARLLTHG